MKTIAGFQTPWHGSRLALFFLLSGIAGAFAQSDPPSPNIRSVRVDGTNVVVTAAVPAGLRRVTLECRERLGPGGWEPRAVVRLDGAGGDVQIRVACARSAELMRVRAGRPRSQGCTSLGFDSVKSPRMARKGKSTKFRCGPDLVV